MRRHAPHYMNTSREAPSRWLLVGIVAWWLAVALLAVAGGCQHFAVPDHSNQLAAPYDTATGQLNAVKAKLFDAIAAAGNSPIVATIKDAASGVDATLATLAKGKADSAKIAKECHDNATHAAAYDKYLADHYNDKFGPWTHRQVWKLVLVGGLIGAAEIASLLWRGSFLTIPLFWEILKDLGACVGIFWRATFGRWLAKKLVIVPAGK